MFSIDETKRALTACLLRPRRKEFYRERAPLPICSVFSMSLSKQDQDVLPKVEVGPCPDSAHATPIAARPPNRGVAKSSQCVIPPPVLVSRAAGEQTFRH